MYQDEKGINTVGVGRNMDDRPISEAVCKLMFDEDMAITLSECANFSWFRDLDQVRKDAIANMVFNLGFTRFRKFENTISLMELGEYADAAEEILVGSAPDGRSKWFHDVKEARAMRISYMLKTGRYPEDDQQ